MRASVIVPARNRADRLDACLATLAHQTLPAEQFEIPVVDNGSSDGTPAATITDLVGAPSLAPLDGRTFLDPAASR